ncbi:MAG: phosphomannomutase/phosphoglucomutase [Caldiserica bacterium]|nr:phosphomannomutase/phosphoglucomutase [Caldisericota bacterium]MDH7562164.1 phosphomannomutase/phosphoglucomutase [Caldisericota bacterium]
MEGIFKAYDIRGTYPNELNEEKAYRIGRAFVKLLNLNELVIGHDARLSSPSLVQAFSAGAKREGCEVTNVGMVSTDMVYFALGYYGYPGACMVTASHNPPQYNGFKLLKENVIPLSGDSGLPELHSLYQKMDFSPYSPPEVKTRDIYEDYSRFVLSFIDPSLILPMKVVMDAGNGVAGLIARQVFSSLPQIEILPLNFVPDGRFPSHEPNPLLPENRREIMESVIRNKADLGIAWDGDADRCFFIDDRGEFVDGYFITALLIEAILRKFPGEKVIFDNRLIWANLEATRRNNGISILNRAGHSFIKARMRQENAIFGGESSGHYYFRENFFADNGMIPALLILELLSVRKVKMSELVGPLKSRYHISGEINIRVDEPSRLIEKISRQFPGGEISFLDGVAVEFPEWRFSLRPSQTEPLVRLNVEALSPGLLKEKTSLILELIKRG